MRKKNSWHSSSTGTVAQNTFRESLESLGYRYTQEDIAISTSTAKRSKGRYDFIVHCKDKDHCIECKSNAGNITIPNCTNLSPHIKSHQLKALREALLDGNKAGLILNFRSKNTWVYLSLKAFDKMVYENYPINAITPTLAVKYGVVVEVSESGKLRLKRILESEE